MQSQEDTACKEHHGKPHVDNGKRMPQRLVSGGKVESKATMGRWALRDAAACSRW
jgi:hypothetical protein